MAGVTSNPKIQIQLLPADIVDAFEDRRDLIVGQQSIGAKAEPKTLIKDVHLKTIDEIADLFGTGELYYRILMWINGNGRYSPLDVITASSPGEVGTAESIITITGTATADGIMTLSVVDEKKFTVTIEVLDGDDGDTIAAVIEDTIYDNEAMLTIIDHFSDLNTVTLSAIDQGLVGETYGVKIVHDVPGIIVSALPFTSTGFNSNPGNILVPILGIRYTGISWPVYWLDDLDIPLSLLEDRFNVSDGIMDGMIFLGGIDTFSSNKLLAQSQNNPSLVIGGNELLNDSLHRGPAILQPPDWVLAYFMGVRSRRLTPGAPIADYIVATGGPLDAIGGPSSASLPYFNTVLSETPVTSPVELYSTEEQIELENAGFTTFGVNSSGNQMIMGPVVTTWTTDAVGNENVSFHYLNYVDTGSACREIFFRTLRSTYAQSRLTEGDLVPGYSMANAESIKAELLRIYRVLANQALVQAGREAESYFSINTTVTINLADRRADIAGPLPIVTQLGSINYALQFSFTVGQTGTQITF